MLVGTVTPELKEQAASILYEKLGLHPTINQQAIMWVDPDDNQVKWIVGYDSFVGKTCQIHTASVGLKSMPRSLIWAGFDYPFKRLGLKVIVSTVDSHNELAMKYNKKLGFQEVMRLEGCHDEGGDIVIFKMNKEDCRWLRG